MQVGQCSALNDEALRHIAAMPRITVLELADSPEYAESFFPLKNKGGGGGCKDRERLVLRRRRLPFSKKIGTLFSTGCSITETGLEFFTRVPQLSDLRLVNCIGVRCVHGLRWHCEPRRSSWLTFWPYYARMQGRRGTGNPHENSLAGEAGHCLY